MKIIQPSSCPICGNVADKKNTHLIPWFLIKDVVTHKGSGLRDKELSFVLSSDNLTKIFAGRSVLPETVDEFGNLSELETEKTNPYSRDNLWCDKCEAKFSRVEAIFASAFSHMKIPQFQPKRESEAPFHLHFEKKLSFSIYQLFIQSIFWRSSFGKFDGFTLKPDTEKKLLFAIQKSFASIDPKKLNLSNQLDIPFYFPLITSVLFTDANSDRTTGYVMINKVGTPYFLIAGKWLFQLFEKEKQIKGTNERLYGLRDILDSATLYPNLETISHAVALNKTQSDTTLRNMLDSFVGKKMTRFNKDLEFFHLKYFGFEAPPGILDFLRIRYFDHRTNGKTELESMVNAFYDLRIFAS